MLWKTFSIVAASLLVACASARGSRPPREVKVFVIYANPEDYCEEDEPWCQGKGGLVRRQDKQVLPFEDATEFFAVSPDDFNTIINNCPR